MDAMDFFDSAALGELAVAYRDFLCALVSSHACHADRVVDTLVQVWVFIMYRRSLVAPVDTAPKYRREERRPWFQPEL